MGSLANGLLHMIEWAMLLPCWAGFFQKQGQVKEGQVLSASSSIQWLVLSASCDQLSGKLVHEFLREMS